MRIMINETNDNEKSVPEEKPEVQETVTETSAPEVESAPEAVREDVVASVEEPAPSVEEPVAETVPPTETEMDMPKPTADEDLDAMLEAIAIDDKPSYEELEAKIAEIEEAKAQVETLLDNLKAEHATLAKRHETFQADWENYRRRTEENLVLEKANASKKLVTAILPPLDDFERAITHAQQTGADAEIINGMYAIYKKMIMILANEGVEQVRGKGEKFNIETQQAIERREGTDMDPDMVAEVYQTGYVMNGVVIRPALVAVTA